MFKLLLSLLTLGALSFGCAATRTRGWSEAEHVEASGPGRLRVLTLNTAHGVRQPLLSFLANRSAVEGNLQSMARALSREDADVVALQEVHAKRIGQTPLNQLDLLAGHAGYDHSFFGTHYERPALDARRGTALLSKSALQSPASTAFKVGKGDDHGWVVATVRAEGLLGIEVDVVSVHLDPYSASKRVEQMNALAAAFADRARPLVVMGDFNADWGGRDGVQQLAQRLGLRAHQPNKGERTFPSAVPLVRVDWILVSPELRILRHRTFREPATDHLGVVADIGLSPRLWARLQGVQTRVRLAEAARAREVPVAAAEDASQLLAAGQGQAPIAGGETSIPVAAAERTAAVPGVEQPQVARRERLTADASAAQVPPSEALEPARERGPAVTSRTAQPAGRSTGPGRRAATAPQRASGTPGVQATPHADPAPAQGAPVPVAKDAHEASRGEPVAALGADPGRGARSKRGKPSPELASVERPRALSPLAARALGAGAGGAAAAGAR